MHFRSPTVLRQHEKGVVHRDLKPENHFVTKDAWLKILDFGLARQNPLATAQPGHDGATLEHRLTKEPLLAEQTIRFAAQIADALAKAHKLGIVHRDLKASNVMLTKSGAKLMDFGLAKEWGPGPLAAALTEMTAEQSKLTAEARSAVRSSMAPEQLEGKEVDARTDIFVLGEVTYEIATGEPAFTGKSRASLIAAILSSEPQPNVRSQIFLRNRGMELSTPKFVCDLLHEPAFDLVEEGFGQARKVRFPQSNGIAGHEFQD